LLTGGSTITITTPDQTITGCKTAPGPKGTIYDPATGFAFPGKKIPPSRLNQAAVNYLNAFPLPSYGTNQGKNTLQNNFYTDPVQTQRYDLGTLTLQQAARMETSAMDSPSARWQNFR